MVVNAARRNVSPNALISRASGQILTIEFGITV